jgi:hypothetical protein
MKISTRKLIPVIIGAGALAIIGGILVLIFGIAAAGSSLTKVLVAIEGVLMILIGLILGYIVLLARDNDVNFFLYDRKSGKNIRVEDLTFDRINSRLGYYMSLISSSQEQMWERNILERDDPRFGTDGVYKPLTAYKMLYDLVEIDRNETWELFTGAAPETVTTLCRVLRSAGEEAMADALLDAYEGAESVDDIEWVRDFVMGNAKYIRRRMREYVLKHIEEFY